MRVLTVCTHNRTRSVIAEALLAGHLARHGLDAVVRSAGTHADGMPPTAGAERLLRDRGIDVSAHRSRRVDGTIAGGADLILTAEPAHVVWIAGQWPEVYARTFTLPEIVSFAERVGPRQGRDLPSWLADLAEHRPPAAAYLDHDGVAEIADPTGAAPRVWNTSFAEIDALTGRLAELLR